MFWRMIFQLWHHDLPRKALAFATIFLASSLIAGLLAVSIDIGDKMSRELKSYGANILIEPAGGALLPDDVAGQPYYLEEKVLPSVMDIFWRNNIYGFAPLLNGHVRAGGVEVAALGTFFDHPLDVADESNYHTGQKTVSPFWQVAGDWPDDSKPLAADAPIPVLVGVKLAAAQGWQTGDVLPLAATTANAPEKSARISGILTSGAAQDEQMVLPLAALQEVLGLQGNISAIQVAAMTVPENDLSRKAHENPSALNAKQYDQWYCTAYVSTIAHQLEETVSGSVVHPVAGCCVRRRHHRQNPAAADCMQPRRPDFRRHGHRLAHQQRHHGARQRNWPDARPRRKAVANRTALLRRSHPRRCARRPDRLHGRRCPRLGYRSGALWRDAGLHLDCRPRCRLRRHPDSPHRHLVPGAQHCPSSSHRGAL